LNSSAKGQRNEDLRHLMDAEVEMIVNGTILRSGQRAKDEVDFLTTDDFASEKGKIVFSAICAEASPTIDAVARRLMATDQLYSIGGLTGLIEIDEKGIEGIRLKGFGQTLRRLATDRRAYRLNQKLSRSLELGLAGNGDEVRAICDELRALQYDLETETPARTFGECLEEAGGIDALCAPPQNMIPIAWHNRLVNGFAAGQLVVGAGRTSSGKTVLGAQQAAHAAKHGHRTLFISLEMSVGEMLKRELAMIARVRHADLQDGILTHVQRLAIEEAAARLSSWPLEITTALRTVDSIDTKVREERKRGNPYRLVVVDYLQLLATTRDYENRTQEVSAISRALKLCAAQNDCVVLALSQLSRAAESRPGDHEPRLSDLRDSGSIEQDADMVLFVHRPELYRPSDLALRNVAKLIVGKHRNGAVGSFDLVWVPQHVTFTEPGMPAGAA
jgi:replicative DNA helicase